MEHDGQAGPVHAPAIAQRRQTESLVGKHHLKLIGFEELIACPQFTNVASGLCRRNDNTDISRADSQRRRSYVTFLDSNEVQTTFQKLSLPRQDPATQAVGGWSGVSATSEPVATP